MNAVPEKQTTELANVQDINGGLLEVIARAARDPNVDIDKMERLLEMQERVHARNARMSYAAALSDMQPRLPVISERGKILNKEKQVQSTYAYWEDVNEAIRPLLAEFGFALSFRTGRQGPDVTVTGVLSHRDGHSEQTTITLPSDGSGSKNAVQSVGSSTSYGKRYTAFALLNITSKGEDDDGATATKFRADGEPMPRAKLDGPHTSKTALRTAVNAIIGDVWAAPSADAISALVKEPANKATIDQAKRDWPALVDGDPKIEEDIGLRGAMAARKAQLVPSDEVSSLIETMKKNQTQLALSRWLGSMDEEMESLSDTDRRTFELACELHESNILTMDQSRA